MKRMYVAGALVAAIAAVGTSAVVTAQSKASTPVTFNKDVLPILQKNCQDCHRPGQIAPMSLLTYEDARPWAKSMKTKVESRQMPPWFADPQYSKFANDKSLKQSDIDTIVKWVDAGAPVGSPKDAPAPVVWPADGWQIKPDVVVKLPEFVVPAHPPGNVIEWTTLIVPSGFTKDTWVTSIEIKPSDISVTHHICIQFQPHTPDVQYYTPIWADKPRDEEGIEVRNQGAQAAAQNAATGSVDGGGIQCYLPGGQAFDFRPYRAGRLIPAGSDIRWTVHYTPIGKDATDKPLLGFTVSDKAPEKRWIDSSAGGTAQAKLAIPPNDPNYASAPGEAEFGADVELVQMQPHMHLRGKDMTFTAEYPDGKKQVLLNVPKYDFNWQLGYTLAEPVRLPKGSKLIVTAHYNNSVSNKYNPNPNRTVYNGNMTWEEMFAPFIAILVDPKIDPKTVLKRGFNTAQGGD